MGKLVLGAILAMSAFAQSAATKQHFLIRIQPVRATFIQDGTPEEQKIMGTHFTYLKKLTEEGKVVLAGPSINGEKTFGLIVVEVENEAEAKAIMEGDPSYKAGIQKGEVLPFRIALLRDSKPAK
jgi:uncharacterized protein